MPSPDVCHEMRSSKDEPLSFGRSAGLRARRAVIEISQHAPSLHVLLLIFLSLTTCGHIHLLDRRIKKVEGDLLYMRVQLTARPCIGSPASMEGIRYDDADFHDETNEVHVPMETYHLQPSSKDSIGDDEKGIETTPAENQVKPWESTQLERITDDCPSSEGSELKTSYMAREAFTQCTKDRDGPRDFAFLHTGGYVIHSLTSSSFLRSNTWRRRLPWSPVLRVFNKHANLPEIALKGDGSVGNCWPLVGSSGQLGVGLSRTIDITAMSIEHIGRQLAQNDITAAPREFELWGLSDDQSQLESETLLFKGVYSISTPSSPLQTFEINKTHPLLYRKVLFKVISNYGNSQFTCIYRVRIHGQPID
ncbi:UNC-like C-terminal-domain-containing protein [Melampsora americana]|nr:UNC-like C-terminal-domain-containing protein [Melampsora americana]KAH9808273.1 UNC-like C-terminal-domain-containing protein [Melampsora americana]KAH9818330.1 UNC-like C-terminal-domain-containing protein [Melampsora americana]